MSIILEPCKWTYIGGRFLPSERAVVPADSHALHYGTAAFESLRIYRTPSGSKVIGLQQHLDRLRLTLSALGLAPIDEELVRDAVLRTAAVNNVEEGYLRLLVYPSGPCTRLDPAAFDSELLIVAWRVSGPRYAPPVSLGVASIRRPPAGSTLPRAKHSGMYGVYAATHSAARLQGFDDALVLHDDGTVCEITGANIFIVRDGELLTPFTPHSIDGVTRHLVMGLAAEHGVPVRESVLAQEDLFTADEIFLTGTFHGIRPVSGIAGHTPAKGAPGPLTAQLQRWLDTMLAEPGEFAGPWLTDVSPQEAGSTGSPKGNSPKGNANGTSNGAANGATNGSGNGVTNGNDSTNGNGGTNGTRGCRVRPALREDIPGILGGIRTLLEELRGVPGIQLPDGARQVCERIIDGRSRGAIFVAYPSSGEQQIVGLLSITVQDAIHFGGPYALIQYLWVHSEYRSHGVGAGLMAAVEGFCREHRLPNLEVCLPSLRFQNLPRTYNFYQENGFVELGPRMRKEVV